MSFPNCPDCKAAMIRHPYSGGMYVCRECHGRGRFPERIICPDCQSSECYQTTGMVTSEGGNYSWFYCQECSRSWLFEKTPDGLRFVSTKEQACLDS